MNNVPLTGRLILVVEDNPFAALGIENTLRMAGAEVIAAASVDIGSAVAQHPRLTSAVVDWHLGGEDSQEICRELDLHGIPFIVYTGKPSVDISREWPRVPVIRKPASPGQIVNSLLGIMI